MFFVSPLAIVFKNSKEEITDANPFAMNLFGYDRPEIIGLSADTLYSTEEIYKKVSKRRMLDSQFIGEVQFKKKNGTEFWGYLVSVVVNDGEGSIEGFLSMILDMSESKNLQQYLIRAEKMAGIGVLASGIAHELNNPLYGILGLAETVLEETDMELIKEYTSDIVRYSKEAAGIIRDLSGYSYSSRTETSSTVDVNAVIHRALQMMKRIDISPALQ
jgi:PAS domain S-box-containing protein